MRSIELKITVVMIVASVIVSPILWTPFGCGGLARESSGTTTSTGSEPTVTLSGTISVPASSTSSLVAGLATKRATTDSSTAAAGMTCEMYTIEGASLGVATVDSAGGYSLAALLDSLKPSDATGTSWRTRFYVKCTDDSGKYDIRNYCEAIVDETSTITITCHATPETTLTTLDLLKKSGCEIGASCSMAGIDPLCFMQMQKTMYQEANVSAGGGIQRDVAAVKEVTRQCMAVTTPGALGFVSAEAMITASRDGRLTSDQLALCGVGTDLSSKYSSGATAVAYMRDIFYSDIAGGSGTSASLALGVKNAIVEAESGSACDLVKGSDTAYVSKLVATYGAANDATELGTMKNLEKTIITMMSQYCPAGSLCNSDSFLKYKPEVMVGTLAGCGMDAMACGFVDANGTLLNVFDKMKLTIDATEKAGVGTDFDALRDLGRSWGDTFKEQGWTAAGSEAAIYQTMQLFGANIGSQGSSYDPTTAGTTFGTYQSVIGTGAVDTCLSTATSDTQKLACYSTSTTTTTTNNTTTSTTLSNGTACSANSQCSSGYCGGTTNARQCKTLGTGANGDVCDAAAQCSTATCTGGVCAISNPFPSTFTVTPGSATANTCTSSFDPSVMSETVNTQTETATSFSTGGFAGTKDGNAFTLTATASETGGGCSDSATITIGGTFTSSSITCSSPFTRVLTVVSGNCMAVVGSNTVGATCTQTFGNTNCTTP